MKMRGCTAEYGKSVGLSDMKYLLLILLVSTTAIAKPTYCGRSENYLRLSKAHIKHTVGYKCTNIFSNSEVIQRIVYHKKHKRVYITQFGEVVGYSDRYLDFKCADLVFGRFETCF